MFKSIRTQGKRVGHRLKTGAAKAMSAPARSRGARIERKSTADFKALRAGMDKEAQRAPVFKADGRTPTDAFKAVTAVPRISKRVQKRTDRITKPSTPRRAVQWAATLGTKKKRK